MLFGWDGGRWWELLLYTNVALRNFTSPHLIKVVGVGCPRNDEQCGGDGVCRSEKPASPPTLHVEAMISVR